jgi:RimJ/RimL family protein N-acetyltransferase
MVSADHISFHPVAPRDLPMLHAWVTAPHVRQWWDAPDDCDEFAAQVIPLLTGRSPKRPFIILHGERPIGYIQVFRVQAIPQYYAVYYIEEEAAGIDLYIGDTSHLHRGLGPIILQSFLSEVVLCDPAVVSCIIGPEPENLAAIRAYEKAGFQYLKTVTLPESGEQQYLMRLGRPE